MICRLPLGLTGCLIVFTLYIYVAVGGNGSVMTAIIISFGDKVAEKLVPVLRKCVQTSAQASQLPLVATIAD